MEQINEMFFGLDVKELLEVPIDKKHLSILDARRNLVKIPLLDKSWPLLTLRNQYVKYPGSSSRDPQLMTSWRQAAQRYHDELHTLTLETSYDRLWCHVLYQPKLLLDFLRSFTTTACRSYDLQDLSKEDAALHARISALCFLFFITVACNRRSKTEHISDKKHGEIVQQFIKLPFLMDMCALYGENRKVQSLLRAGLNACFEKNRRLYTEFRIALRDISDSLFQPLEERFSELEPDMGMPPVSELPTKDLVDIVGYICDILSTLQRISVVANDQVLAVMREAKLSFRLVQFGEKVVWILDREVAHRLNDPDGGSAGLQRPDTTALQHVLRQGGLMEWALVDTFRRLECAALVEDAPTGPAVAACLVKLLETLPHYQLFTVMYEKWAPIKRDVQLATRLQANVEESIVDFLAHAVAEAFHSQKLPWNYVTSGSGVSGDKRIDDPPKTTAPSIPTKPVAVVGPTQKPVVMPSIASGGGDAKLDEATNQILEMLDGMGLDSVYVKACVGHYKCDVNATVDAILSGSVPMEIANSTTPVETEKPLPSKPTAQETRKPPSYPTSQQQPCVSSSLPRYTERAVAHTAPGTVIEKVYYGKRDLYEETEQETISDETRLVTIARVQQMYDDEYDDTYDEFETETGAMRLNDKDDAVAKDLQVMAEEEKAKKQPPQPNTTTQFQPSAPRQAHERFPSRGPQRGAATAPVPGGAPPRHQKPHQPAVVQPTRQDRLAAERLPPTGVVPNNAHKQVRRREDQFNDDEEEPQATRSNDPWQRQVEDSYNAQCARRPPGTQQSAGGTTGHSNEARNRDNKEKNKAFAGNHNRKDRGQWKRNQGML